MNQYQRPIALPSTKTFEHISSRLHWPIGMFTAALFLLVATLSASAEEKHAGAPLADLIESNDCTLRQDDQIVKKLSAAEISVREFQDQTAALFADGYLRSEEQGQVLRLVGWGECE